MSLVNNGLALRNSKALQVVLHEYEKYAVFSNLKLNYKTCCVIPLFYVSGMDIERAKEHSDDRAENGSEPGGRARTRYKVILKWAMYIKL